MIINATYSNIFIQLSILIGSLSQLTDLYTLDNIAPHEIKLNGKSSPGFK